MSSKTDEKRAEIAEWTAKHLEQGSIPWQSPSVQSADPKNAVSNRPYKGLNALYLLEKSKEEGFTDSRWITLKDANSQGCKVKAGSKGVSLEYWGTRDGNTGTHSYSVFNVEQLDSFPARKAETGPHYDKANAILKKAGTAIPQNRDENAYCAALGKTLADAATKTPLFNDVHTQDLKALRLSIASTFLMGETHVNTTQDITNATAQSWATSIKQNPAELFKAIRDAGKLVDEMTQGLEQVQSNTAEREAAPQSSETEKKETPIVPKVGDRVTFRVKGSDASLTGEVAEMDNFKGTVTMKCGDKAIPVFRGKGSFFKAPPLEQNETKEYAQKAAWQHAGENGNVYFAKDEGKYTGVIVETTPTFALQAVSQSTVILHRLKDLGKENKDQVQKGRDVVIHKEAGKVTVSPNQVQQKHRETAGLGR
jgi:antirestriction protein ArdC